MSGSKGHIVSSTLWDITQNIATCEEGIWISKSLKSGIQGFGIRNTAEGFLNPTNDWNQNPRSTDKGRNSFEKYPCGLQLTENILTGF